MNQLTQLHGPLGRKIQQHRRELLSVAKRYGVSNLRVFGSVARSEETIESDIDLLVDLPPTMGLFGLGQLQQDFEDLLHARVDVIPSEGLKLRVQNSMNTDLVAL